MYNQGSIRYSHSVFHCHISLCHFQLQMPLLQFNLQIKVPISRTRQLQVHASAQNNIEFEFLCFRWKSVICYERLCHTHTFFILQKIYSSAHKIHNLLLKATKLGAISAQVSLATFGWLTIALCILSANAKQKEPGEKMAKGFDFHWLF